MLTAWTVRPWDKMLMASGDMTEWVIVPRDTVDAWPDTASDSCNPTSACGEAVRARV